MIKKILIKIKSAYYVLGDYHRRRKYDNIQEGYVKKDVMENNWLATDKLLAERPFALMNQFSKPLMDISFEDDINKIEKSLDKNKNSNYYIQSFRSNKKLNKSGDVDVEEKFYVNKNGKVKKKSRKYKTKKKDLFSE